MKREARDKREKLIQDEKKHCKKRQRGKQRTGKEVKNIRRDKNEKDNAKCEEVGQKEKR